MATADHLLPWLIVIALVIVIVIQFIIGRQQRKRIESAFQKRLQLEKTWLDQNLPSHFTYNVFSAIQYHILKGDKETSNQFLKAISLLLRAINETSTDTFNALGHDLQQAELLLQLETLRSDQNLTYSIDLPQPLYDENIQVPSLILIPAIHYLMDRNNKEDHKHSNIHIAVDETNSILQFNVDKTRPAIAGEKMTYRQLDSSIPVTLEYLVKRLSLLYMDKFNIRHFSIIVEHDSDVQTIGQRVQIEIPVKFA